MTTAYVCPGCGGASLAATAAFPPSVFTLNYLHRTREEAVAAPAAPLRLHECADCGLVHVPSDEPARSLYDEAYENTQEHSAVFLEHLRSVRDLLAPPGGAGCPCRVLEVGCGKGGFLRLLGELPGWSGDGYDTTYSGPPTAGSLRFHRQYVAPETVAGRRYDLVVCRHVIEHVPQIGAFLKMLAELLHRTGAGRLMLETPDFGWILENGAFWDVFHEHRNYFSRPTLARLCGGAGLRVAEHLATFGGQYQNVVLDACVEPPRHDDTHPPEGGALAAFRAGTAATVARVAQAIRDASQSRPWAIWGAGAKGVSLANHLMHEMGEGPAVVFDINPAKQGSFLPGCGTPILAPTGEALRGVAAIVVANPVYIDEVRIRLIAAGTASVALLALR